MPKDNVKPDTQETVQVKYMGHSVSVQSNHNWVAVSKLPFAGGESHFITSFAEKPVLLPNGSYVAQVGSAFTYLLLINDKVDKFPLLERNNKAKDSKASPEENLIKAALLLSTQLKQIINGTEDKLEAVHGIYCPDHGILPKFIDSIMDDVVELFGTEDDEDDDDEVEIASLADLIVAIKEAAAKEKRENEEPKSSRFS